MGGFVCVCAHTGLVWANGVMLVDPETYSSVRGWRAGHSAQCPLQPQVSSGVNSRAYVTPAEVRLSGSRTWQRDS